VNVFSSSFIPQCAGLQELIAIDGELSMN
jgi:hypothetical protein